jgi:hypothetical protein
MYAVIGNAPGLYLLRIFSEDLISRCNHRGSGKQDKGCGVVVENVQKEHGFRRTFWHPLGIMSAGASSALLVFPAVACRKPGTFSLRCSSIIACSSSDLVFGLPVLDDTQEIA